MKAGTRSVGFRGSHFNGVALTFALLSGEDISIAFTKSSRQNFSFES